MKDIEIYRGNTLCNPKIKIGGKTAKIGQFCNVTVWRDDGKCVGIEYFPYIAESPEGENTMKTFDLSAEEFTAIAQTLSNFSKKVTCNLCDGQS